MSKGALGKIRNAPDEFVFVPICPYYSSGAMRYAYCRPIGDGVTLRLMSWPVGQNGFPPGWRWRDHFTPLGKTSFAPSRWQWTGVLPIVIWKTWCPSAPTRSAGAGWAVKFLYEWCPRAMRSRLKPMKRKDRSPLVAWRVLTTRQKWLRNDLTDFGLTKR